MHGYVGNIEEKTLLNQNYREVVHTGPDSQLVIMSLLPGEEIGLESHSIDQFVRIEDGEGEVTLNGEVSSVTDGFAVVVPAGTMHNVKNTGSKPLKLYTIYSAPEHPAGTIHKTKADSVRDEGH